MKSEENVCPVCADTGKMHVVQPTMMIDEWRDCEYCKPQVSFVHANHKDCPCEPELSYVAPDGTAVYVHKELQ